MKKKRAVVILSLLLVILLDAQAVCDQPAYYLDFAAGHHVSLIQCPDCNIQAASTIRSDSRSLSKVLPVLRSTIDSTVLVPRFKHDPFLEPFSQQGLFRFDEVYRL